MGATAISDSFRSLVHYAVRRAPLAAVGLLLCATTCVRAEDLQAASALITLIDQAEISTGEAGVVASLQVSEGGKVKAGEPVARLDDADAELARERALREVEVARAQAESRVKIESAEAALELATTERNRARESVAKFPRSVSPAEMDRFELAVKQAGLAIQQAEHEQRVLQLTLRLRESELAIATRMAERRTILAPFDGVAVEIYSRPGEWIEPGERILRLVRMDRLRVEGFLPAAQVRPDLVGCAVSIQIEGVATGAAMHRGRLVFVSPEVDSVNRQVRVLAEVDNQRLELSPGLPAKMIIHQGTRR